MVGALSCFFVSLRCARVLAVFLIPVSDHGSDYRRAPRPIPWSANHLYAPAECSLARLDGALRALKLLRTRVVFANLTHALAQEVSPDRRIPVGLALIRIGSRAIHDLDLVGVARQRDIDRNGSDALGIVDEARAQRRGEVGACPVIVVVHGVRAHAAIHGNGIPLAVRGIRNFPEKRRAAAGMARRQQRAHRYVPQLDGMLVREVAVNLKRLRMQARIEMRRLLRAGAHELGVLATHEDLGAREMCQHAGRAAVVDMRVGDEDELDIGEPVSQLVDRVDQQRTSLRHCRVNQDASRTRIDEIAVDPALTGYIVRTRGNLERLDRKLPRTLGCTGEHARDRRCAAKRHRALLS